MKKTITLLLVSLFALIAKAQITPTLYNSLGSEYAYSSYLDKTANEMYICYTDIGVISKVNLTIPNQAPTVVFSGLSYPVAVERIENKLYVLEATTGEDTNLMPLPNTGKLSYYDLSLANPIKVVLYNNLNIPLKMTANSNHFVIDENTISTVDPDDFDIQTISKVTVSGTLTKTSILTRYHTPNDPLQGNFENMVVIDEDLYANNLNYVDLGYIFKINLLNNSININNTFGVNAPINFGINQNYIYYSDNSSSNNAYRTPLVAGSSPTQIISNFQYNGEPTYINSWHFDSSNNAFIMATTYTNNVETNRIFKIPSSSLLSTSTTTVSILKLYTNPAKTQLNFSEELSEIKIVDMSGKQISVQKEKAKTINVEKLPKGNYLISAKDKNGKTLSEKFIKE